ncbi:hypothetical protein EDB86DRAFT_714711 [Lactarius hatsudake]|nr:hypothetical protein EDB86DRAFT_714711 [Lactarius hatsudake]
MGVRPLTRRVYAASVLRFLPSLPTACTVALSRRTCCVHLTSIGTWIFRFRTLLRRPLRRRRSCLQALKRSSFSRSRVVSARLHLHGVCDRSRLGDPVDCVHIFRSYVGYHRTFCILRGQNR